MAVPGVQAAAIPHTDFRITSSYGLQVACARWDGRAPALGAVQIAHGMGEHMGRYFGTISVLARAGFNVYANDHRGHGHTAPCAEEFGHFGVGGFDLLVDEMVRLTELARKENPNLPLFLFGAQHGLLRSAAVRP